jgi:hypothetical protein
MNGWFRLHRRLLTESLWPAEPGARLLQALPAFRLAHQERHEDDRLAQGRPHLAEH